MTVQLFEGEKIRLAAFDPERDAPIFSRWSHDREYLRLVQTEPALPLSAFWIKSKFQELEKKEGREFYYFTLRTRDADRVIGFAHINFIEWNHGNALLHLGIGSPSDRRMGYGSEALQLLLRYVFQEMNLYRLTVVTTADNLAAQNFLAKHGFQCEVRRRQAIHRDDRYWDSLSYGILASEWQANHE